jgi:hypothetical protein
MLDLSNHRVQLRIRGQRFESAASTLVALCTEFRTYFDQLSQAAMDSSDPLPLLEMRLCDNTMPATSISCPVVLDKDKKLFQIEVASTTVQETGQESVDVPSVPQAAAATRGCGALDAEFVGVILVYLRNYVKKQGEARLTARWDEMPFDQQRSFARVVNAFGVEPLQPQYGTPTAAPGAPVAGASDVAMLHGGRSLVDVAREYVAERASVSAAGSATSAGDQEHPSVADEDLLMPASACYRCGVSGHDAAACTR